MLGMTRRELLGGALGAALLAGCSDIRGRIFVSDDAAYVTGQTISVDGGHWMLG